MSRTVRIIDAGEEGEVMLVANEAYFIAHDDEGLTLKQAPGASPAITIEEDGTFYYTVPYDVTLYGRSESRSRVSYRGVR